MHLPLGCSPGLRKKFREILVGMFLVQMEEKWDKLLMGSKTNTGEVPAASKCEVCWHVQQKRNIFTLLERGRQEDGRRNASSERNGSFQMTEQDWLESGGRGSDSQATGILRGRARGLSA